MALVKLRRDGNSIVVTIPADEIGKAQLAEGDYVEIAAVESGQIVISPVAIEPRVRPEVRAAIEQVAAENRAVLDRLAAYDRGESEAG